MDLKEITTITVKMSGLALVIYGMIQAISSLPLIMATWEQDSIGLSYLSTFSASVFFGVVLWLIPSRVANSVILDKKVISEASTHLGDFESIVIRGLGIILLYQALSQLLANYVAYNQVLETNFGDKYFAGNEVYVNSFYVLGFEIVLAIGLIVGAKGLVNVFQKIRYAS